VKFVICNEKPIKIRGKNVKFSDIGNEINYLTISEDRFSKPGNVYLC